MTIKGLKKAVGEYKTVNGYGALSPHYGYLMLNRETGELWTDEHYDLGHNTYIRYANPAIINLISWAANRTPEQEQPLKVSMKTVSNWAQLAIVEYNAK